MRKTNKQGFSAFMVQPFIFAIFVIMIIFFLVLIHFNKQAIEDDITKQQLTIDGRTLILNFLQLPITIHNEEMTNADLIRLYCFETVLTGDADSNNQYQPLLKQEVFKYFNKVYGENTKSNTQEWWEFELLFLEAVEDTDNSLTLIENTNNFYHYSTYPTNRDSNVNKGSQVISLNKRLTSPVTIPAINGGNIEIKVVSPKTPYIHFGE